MNKYLPILPEIIFFLLILAYFLIGLFYRKRQLLSVLLISILFITSLFLFEVKGITFNGMFVADNLSQSLKLVFLLSGLLCVLISMKYEQISNVLFYEYGLLLLLSILAMMFIVSSKDFIPLFLSIEFMSLCIYLLSGFVLFDLKSNEAALKYYILGSFTSAIFLFGIAALYGLTGTTSFEGVAEFLKKSTNITFYYYIASIGIITAFAFKAGCAPFHQWSPDVYEGAPTTITAFMSVAPKAAVLGAMGRIIFEAFSPCPQLWVGPLILVAILTMATGNILALRQTNLKRLLAYSSIAHAGYVMLAVLACSYEGLLSIVFYMIVYTFMNLGAFTVILALPEGENLEKYQGISMVSPFLSLCMLAFLGSLAGIPPFGGFLAKFLVFKSVIHSGYTWVALIGILFSVLSAYYYLRIAVKMFFIQEKGTKEIRFVIPINLKISLSVNAFCILLTGIIPSLVLI